jgi:hypothetical protein
MLDKPGPERKLNATRQYASIEKVLKENHFLAHSVKCLTLLGVSLNECTRFVSEKTGERVGAQALRFLALKLCGAKGITEFLDSSSHEITDDEKQRSFLEAREYAKQTFPSEMWRKDPGINYCLRELLAEECTTDFTLTRKASIVQDVLKDQGVDVKLTTIRKVLDGGQFEPTISLLSLYPTDYLNRLRTHIADVITRSKKARIDNTRFEHGIWKDRLLCIKLAQAIMQGASIKALSFLVRENGYEFKPESFQKFLIRSRVNEESYSTEANRMAAVDALRKLHTITTEEIDSEELLVRHFLTNFQSALGREMTRANELTKSTQARAGLAVFRNQALESGERKLPNEIVNFTVRRKGSRRVLIVTTYPDEIALRRKQFAKDIATGVLNYSDGHDIIDFDNMMYSLRGVVSMKIVPPPGEYKLILKEIGARAIEFREVRAERKRSTESQQGYIAVDQLFNESGAFALPGGAVVGESQYVLRTSDGHLLHDVTLSKEPLRVGFRRAHYHNDAAQAIQYAADIIDNSNVAVATLLCTKSEEGIFDWLKENDVADIEFDRNDKWLQIPFWIDSRNEEDKRSEYPTTG